MKLHGVLLAASFASACILQDKEIDVINEDIQNKQSVRIAEPVELTQDALDACAFAAHEADDRDEVCPQPGMGSLPHFLDPRIPTYDFCACDPGERHKPIRESTLYVEDRDIRKKKMDSIFAALQLDLDPDSLKPHLYVRYTDFVNPQVALDEDDQIEYRPVKRPDPHVRVLKLGAGDDRIDLCNDVGDLDQPLASGYHTVRLIVTDRPWFTDPNGGPQPGVPDLSAGATYDTRTYVFHCTGKTPPEKPSELEVAASMKCQVDCVPEDGV